MDHGLYLKWVHTARYGFISIHNDVMWFRINLNPLCDPNRARRDSQIKQMKQYVRTLPSTKSMTIWMYAIRMPATLYRLTALTNSSHGWSVHTLLSAHVFPNDTVMGFLQHLNISTSQRARWNATHTSLLSVHDSVLHQYQHYCAFYHARHPCCNAARCIRCLVGIALEALSIHRGQSPQIEYFDCDIFTIMLTRISQQGLLATYFISGCVGRGVRLGSGGAGAGGDVCKSGNLGIWKSQRLESQTSSKWNNQNVLPKIIARFWSVEKHSSWPLLEPFQAFLTWTRQMQTKIQFPYFLWWSRNQTMLLSTYGRNVCTITLPLPRTLESS